MKQQKTTLSDRCYQALRDRILDGEMKPAVFYTEQAVADEFGISKATARDVMHRLCFTGYMTQHARKGYSVNMVLGEEFLQIQQVRYVVEGLAIRLVIRNCSAEEIKSLFSFAPTPFNTGMTNEMQNQKFHTEIGRLSKNEAARQIIFDMTGIASRAAHTFKYLQESTPEYSHEALVEARLNRDVDRSLQILRKHLALDSEGL